MSEFPPSRNVLDLTAVDYAQLRFPMLVIYDRPSDFPEHVVIRVWDMTTPTNIIHLSANITEAEAAIPHWFTKMSRADDDDPKIVATFI